MTAMDILDEFRAVSGQLGTTGTEPTLDTIRQARIKSPAQPIYVGPFHPQDPYYLWLKSQIDKPSQTP